MCLDQNLNSVSRYVTLCLYRYESEHVPADAYLFLLYSYQYK